MPEVPVIIGVSDITNRSLSLNPSSAHSPLTLITSAINQALSDALASTNSQSLTSLLKSSIDSLSVVRTWTWPYSDLPASLCHELNITTSQLNHKEYTRHGGDQPGVLLDDAARRIAAGECKVAVICGGEALATLNQFIKERKTPPWPKSHRTPVESQSNDGDDGKGAKRFDPTTAANAAGILGDTHGIGAPIQVYPLYENALRAHRGQSIKENHDESCKLYAEFSKVACGNEFAWQHGRHVTAEEIGRVDGRNRMICLPYPLQLNAFNTVNLASCVILSSYSFATSALSIPASRLIYPLSGAATSDSGSFVHRPNFYSSPAITNSLRTALDLAGLKVEDVDLWDFYSCFPVVPKLAARELGLGILRDGDGEGKERTKPLTLLGGLTSFGGAGNNYSMHAFTAMVRALREGEYGGKQVRTGCVLANGGVVTYQCAVVLGKQNPMDNASERVGGGWRYPAARPLEQYTGVKGPEVLERVPEDERLRCVVETYTVDFKRDRRPGLGHIVLRIRSGDDHERDGGETRRYEGMRVIANHGDERTLRELASSSREPIGRIGTVFADKAEGRRNIFIFDEEGKL